MLAWLMDEVMVTTAAQKVSCEGKAAARKSKVLFIYCADSSGYAKTLHGLRRLQARDFFWKPIPKVNANHV
jgi:hypothetical protein